MPDMDFWRQLEIISPTDFKNLQVTVIGVGGIGSPTTLALAKMGVPKIKVFDDDSVEIHNLPNQLYRFSDMNKPKVEALKAICLDFTGVEIEAVNQKFLGKHKLSGIVVSGVDSMDARKKIWDSVKFKPGIDVYIEARMGAEVAMVYTIRPCDPDDIKFYEKQLYTDEEAVTLPCSARDIIYNVFMISALISSQVKKFIKAQPYKREIVFDIRNLIMEQA